MLTALSKQLMPPWMQSMARRAKLERSLKTFERRVVTHRFGGIDLTVSLCDRSAPNGTTTIPGCSPRSRSSRTAVR